VRFFAALTKGGRGGVEGRGDEATIFPREKKEKIKSASSYFAREGREVQRTLKGGKSGGRGT